ncbi:MAG TPA: hypothetical protein VGM91_10710 [Conexibacter sp.]|jgi:hypothetical protein
MDDTLVALFLSAPKELAGDLRWSEYPNRTQVGVAVVTSDAVAVGQTLAVVLAVRERRWAFKLKAGAHRALEWNLIPEGEVRRHFNRCPRPPGFPVEDRSPIHEHVWIDGRKLSCPVEGLALSSHREVFHAFCKRANIDPKDAYTQPTETQLTLRR